MFRGKSLYSKFLLAVPAIAVSLPALAVDEIIVTAERIEANLQEVPMAVTALSAADLETNNITSTMELTKTVPGMVYRRNTGTASASNVYIRGFGDDESRLTDPTTGLYIDGVYVGRPYGSLVELIDAGSVEVLRGPQGTLYGRNTIAGAIKINSADRGENGGNFAVSVGDEGYRKVKGGFSYGINDSSGIIFSALHE
ncbi:MAG: TonB-dependent receptor plug domain-containing protein, partial [Candidatus Micropelagos thuwalensis]